MSKEKRSLRPHPQLLVDIVRRQAGSLWKAIIEGVMNAVDAGASKCDIELTREQLIIRDNGKGFRARKEIETYFEEFGLPHESREKKTFGTFRMGRGQLFAFGSNTWRSGKFEMTIDINRDGLDYHLEDGLDRHDGCTITIMLYKPLSHTDYARMLTEIAANAKYVSIDVTLNGKKFTADTSKISWNLELPEADIVFRQNQDLRVYNQGIKVMSYYRSRYGVGGDIVTKQALKVNFARNDIMDDCPVWASIVKALQKHSNAKQTNTRASSSSSTTRTRAKPVRLTEEDRIRLCNQAKDGALEKNQFKSARLFQKRFSTTNLTVRQIANIAGGIVTFAPLERYSWKNEELVKRITMNKMACVLDAEVLIRFDLKDGPELVALVNRIIEPYDKYALTYAEWDELVAELAADCQIVPDEQLNRVEAVVLGVLRICANGLLCHFHHYDGGPEQANVRDRRIVLGRGPRTSWTDGKSYIAINREFVRRMKFGPNAWMCYAHLIMHEALHPKSTMAGHQHSKMFYEQYHDWCGRGYGISSFAYDCTIRTPGVAASVRQRLSEMELQSIDRIEQGQALAEAECDLTADAPRTAPGAPAT